MWAGETRKNYHHYPTRIKSDLKNNDIEIDQRSNGPVVMAYLRAGGERPDKTVKGEKKAAEKWDIAHTYDGKFPFPGHEKTLYAVKNGSHFTQSAGLVAASPIAHACANEYFWFA